MAAKAGKLADIDISGQIATLLGNWSLSYDTDSLETTGFTDAGNRTYIAGLEGASFTMSGLVDWSNTSQGLIKTALQGGTTKVVKLFENGSKYWELTALFTNVTETASVDGAITVDITGVATGSVSYN